ncbi:MAG: glutamyl-tRNA reductase, partial [Candidatus Omnitrophica bacterium]|nr:glutamyl-tRNA reductase [Candidatus Omnitrophota bacterium]
YRALCASEAVAQAMILSTCNRVELYAAGESQKTLELALRDFLKRTHAHAGIDYQGHLYRMSGYQAAMHLFHVAAGLDSMIPGENQILGQIKRAYDLAVRFGAVGPHFHQLMQDALRIGKRVRSETQITRGVTSMAGAVLEMIKKVPDLKGKRVLVIGAGKIGAMTVEKLAKTDVREVVVVNRGKAKTECLEQLDKVRVKNYEDLTKALGRADIVVAATASTKYVISHAQVQKIMHDARQEMHFFDLGVPRNIEESVGQMAGVQLYNVDHMGSFIDDVIRSRSTEIKKAQAIIRKSAVHLSRRSVIWKNYRDRRLLYKEKEAE